MLSRRIVRSAALAFLLSRGLILVLLIIGSQIAFIGKAYSGSVWETRIVLERERILPELRRMVMIGDAWFYRSIAAGGYEARASSQHAFFPLYPLVVRHGRVTGDFALDAMIVSHLSFAIALLLLGSLMTRMGFAAEDAERAMFVVAFFPMSHFFSLPMTESPFLALSLGAFVAAAMNRWWLAGILGGLAALTRAPGVLLVLPLAALFLERNVLPRFRILWLALIPAGTASFAWHLGRVTGNPLAFLDAQRLFHREPQWFWTPVVNAIANPAMVGTRWNLIAWNLAAVLLLLAATVALVAQRRWSLALYALASTLLPLSSGSLQSVSRYALVVFPLFLWLGTLGARPLADRTITALSIAGFGWLLAFFILRVDFALA